MWRDSGRAAETLGGSPLGSWGFFCLRDPRLKAKEIHPSPRSMTARKKKNAQQSLLSLARGLESGVLEHRTFQTIISVRQHFPQEKMRSHPTPASEGSTELRFLPSAGLWGTPIKYDDVGRATIKGWKMICHADGTEKNAEGAALKSEGLHSKWRGRKRASYNDPPGRRSPSDPERLCAGPHTCKIW